ncbi:MAG: PAS domain S-box protein [Desulfobacterales bacterium]
MKKFDAGRRPDTAASSKPTPGDAKPASNADPEAAPHSFGHLPPEPVSAAGDGTFEHKILMSSLNGIYIYDLETGVNTFINPQYTRLTGYVLEDLQSLVGAELLALVHPEDRKRVAAHLGRIGRAADDETLEIEYRFKAADGRWMWCLAKEAVFERDGNGRVQRIIGTFLDITARKKAGKKLEQERELLQKLIETIPVMITVYDPALQCFSFNREFRRVLGWSEQDLHNGDPMEKFYADPAERAAARQFMESLETGWRTLRVTARDGGTVESAWANIRLSDDTRVGIGIDIRERTAELKATVVALENEMQARRDLENKLRQWARVFMDAADPIIIENLSGTIIDMNREAERKFGWKRQELIGKSIHSLIPPDRRQRAESLRERCRRGQEVRNWEGLRQDQKGRSFSVLLTAFPLLDESGKITAVATIAKDITERKQMEMQLEQSQNYLRELSRKSIEALENDRRTTGKELHDSIGASLAFIKLKLEAVAEDMDQKPELAAASLTETISYLQAAIKETKQIAANLRPTILDDLGLLSTIKWYTRRFSKQFKDIRLTSQIEIREEDIPDTLKIVIYRVLQESLHNAARHSEATEIGIRLKSDADWIALEVVDNGCGFNVRKILSREDPLSGFGLASMIERAEIVGGSLTIDSAAGRGTRIRMNLPRVPYAV